MEIFKSTDPASQTESAAESAQLFFAEMLGDPLAYDRSTGAAAELCRKAEIDSLQDLLVGDVTDSAQMVFRLPSKPNRPTPKPAELDFAKSFVSGVLRHAARAGEVAKSEPRRKREIAAIIDRWADRYSLPAAVQPQLNRVKESCSRFVHQALVEELGS